METLNNIQWAKYTPTTQNTINLNDDLNLDDSFNLQLQSYQQVENPVKQSNKTSNISWFNNPFAVDVSSSTEQKVSNNTMVNYFVNKGLTYNQARGLVGNLLFESGGGVYDIIQGGKHGVLQVDGKTGFGLGQWTTKDRQQRLLNFAKTNKPTAQQQLDFIWWELNNTHKKALEDLKKTKTIAEATKSVMDNYENPGIKHYNERLKYANA